MDENDRIIPNDQNVQGRHAPYIPPAIILYATMSDEDIMEQFEHMDLIDLTSAAFLSKRLADLAKPTFSTRFRRIVLPDDFNLSYQHFMNGHKALFHHFGYMIVNLSWTVPYLSNAGINQFIAHLIWKYCTKLKYLYLKNYNFFGRAVRRLQPTFKRLKTLELNDCDLVRDSWKLFADCAELEVLKIELSKVRPLVLGQIFPRLRDVQIKYLRNLRFNHLYHFLENHKALQVLVIYHQRVPNDIFRNIIHRLRALEVLQIGEQFSHVDRSIEEKNSVLKLSKLKSLKELNLLVENLPTVNLLKKFARKAIPIQSLGFCVPRIDTNTINAICILKSLQELSLSDATISCADSIRKIVDQLPMLKHLHLIRVHRFNVVMLKELIPHIAQLTKLDVNAESIYISQNDYDYILEIVRGYHADNEFVLKLIIDESKFEVPTDVIEANYNCFDILQF